MRLFFAVDIPGEIQRYVTSAVAGSGLVAAPWRWIPPENFHITLKFLGETEASILPRLRDAASTAALGHRRFRLSLTDFGAFPDLRRPRVLFYGLGGDVRELAGLAGSVDKETAKLGFQKETRPFKAHLTLARVRTRPGPEIIERLEKFPSLPGSAFTTVERFHLIRSHLGRGGASYEKIATFDLRG